MVHSKSPVPAPDARKTPPARAPRRAPASTAHETETPTETDAQASTAPQTLDQCRRCELWRNATQAVPGAGTRTARMMLVGEQPGDQEDLAGQPFVGPAGQILARALAQAHLVREEVFVTNAVKHFKWELRGKRRLHKTPVQREIEACSYWLERELAEVKPTVIVALGATALRAVLGRQEKLADHMGHPLEQDGRWIVATYHPSYVLRLRDSEAREAAFGLIANTLVSAKRIADHGRPA